MFQRYTAAARRAVYFANLEAVHRDEQSISAGDILVGLTWEEKTRAGRIGLLKDRAVELRALVRIPHLPSTAFPYRRRKEIPLDHDSKRIVWCASLEAEDDGQYWIDTDHLLRAILCFPNVAAEALNSEGVTLEQVRTAASVDRKSLPPDPAPKFAHLRLLFERHGHLLGWVVLALVMVMFLKYLLWT